MQSDVALTGRRRWNVRFKGSHVTVHGATRHTASALLLSGPKGAKCSDHVIMEIQQRHDVGTFKRHYCHAHEEDVAEALENASVPVSFAVPSENPGPISPKAPEPTATVPALAPEATLTPAGTDPPTVPVLQSQVPRQRCQAPKLRNPMSAGMPGAKSSERQASKLGRQRRPAMATRNLAHKIRFPNIIQSQKVSPFTIALPLLWLAPCPLQIAGPSGPLQVCGGGPMQTAGDARPSV